MEPAISPPCVKLTRAEVPPPPQKKRNDFIDQDGQRWRFNAKGELIVYILYNIGHRDDPRIFPWAKLWVPEYG